MTGLTSLYIGRFEPSALTCSMTPFTTWQLDAALAGLSKYAHKSSSQVQHDDNLQDNQS